MNEHGMVVKGKLKHLYKILRMPKNHAIDLTSATFCTTNPI
jgi:hypothetical protein